MLNAISASSNSPLTMTSREIADLCEKRHDNVMADCRKLIEFYAQLYSPEKSGEFIREGSYRDATGRVLPCFELNKQASLDLVTGYSLPHRHAVNKRWMELEIAGASTAELPAPEKARFIRQTMEESLALAQLCGFAGNQAILSANRATIQLAGVAPLALLGAESLIAETQEPLLTSTEVGMALGLGRNRINPHLQEHGLITGYRDHKNRQCWELTEKGKAAGGIYVDTGKKHGGGEPVRAIKWQRGVVHALRGLNS